MYFEGDGVEKDMERALELLQEARQRGNAAASMERGDLVRFKHGDRRLGVLVKVAEDAVRVFVWSEDTHTFDAGFWIRRTQVRQVFKTTDGEKDTLATEIGYTCRVCGVSGFRENLSHCVMCPGVRYCSKDCQQADWTRHKQHCPGRRRAF